MHFKITEAEDDPTGKFYYFADIKHSRSKIYKSFIPPNSEGNVELFRWYLDGMRYGRDRKSTKAAL